MPKNISRLKMSAALLMGTALGFTSLPAFAQSDEEEARDGEREIIVTATKRETNLMQTPIAVTAMDQQALDEKGVQDVVDLGSLVPGLIVGHSPSDSGVQVSIRGISSNNFTEIGDPTVGIHIDGVYSPRPQAGLALMFDTEQVEILRGPQGTLFGRNSTAGAINIKNKKPQLGEWSAKIDLGAGAYNKKAARGWANLALHDKFALRISGMTEQADSYITQEKDEFDLDFDAERDGSTAGPNDFPADGIVNTDQRRNHDVDDSDAYFNTDQWAFRAALRFQPIDNMDWVVSYDKFQDDGAGRLSLKDCEKAEGTFFACDGHDSLYASVNVPGKMDFSIETLRSVFEYQFNDYLQFEYRVAHAKQSRFQQYDGDAGAFVDPDHPAYGINRICCGTGFGPLGVDHTAAGAVGWTIGGVPGVPDGNGGFLPVDPSTDTGVRFPFEDLQLTTRYSNYDSLVNELQLKSIGDNRFDWILGYFTMKEENDIRFDVEIPFCCAAGIPLAQSFLQPDRRVNSDAIFGQIDWEMNDRLNFTLGYRHTWDEKEDRGGSNHETIGYWVNPNLYDPSATPIWLESWGLLGVEPFWSGTGNVIQGPNLTPEMGSLADNFVDRIPGTDNSNKEEWDKATWKIGFDYLHNDTTFIYGSVGTGFKAGGFGDGVVIAGNRQFFPYDPEENITYELGMKKSMLDGDLKILANAFFSDYKDMQQTRWSVVGQEPIFDVNGNPVLDVNGNPQTRDIGTLLTDNIAEAEIKGIEFEFDWWGLWPGGHVYGWVTYLDAQVTSYPGADDGWFCFERALLGLTPCPSADTSQPRGDGTFRRPTDYSGNKLPWSPEWSFDLTAEHYWYFDNGLKLSPWVHIHWQDKIYFDIQNFDEGPFFNGQDSFMTVDASLRLINEQDQWGAEVYVRNLTDELTRSWGDPGPGYLRSNFNAPRMWGVRFNKQF